MVGAGVPLRVMVNTAGAAAMMGLAVYLAQTINLEGLAPGALPTAVAAVAMMGALLAGPSVNGREAEAPNRGGRQKKEPAHVIEGHLLSVSAAMQSPTQVLPSPPTLRVSDTTNDVAPTEPTEVQKQSVDQRNDGAEQTNVMALGSTPVGPTTIGWKMASFILQPSDAAWCEMRGCLAQVARPATCVVIEAVVLAARRQWHSGDVPHLKDAFIADIIAAPEVKALGPLKPRMDVVRKVLDGKHPTLIRAARIQRSA